MRFTSNAETTLSFSLVVTAIGNTPATLSLPTTIKIVDCSNGNVISGGSWDQNQLFTELSAGLTTDLTISPYVYSKPDCSLSAYSISGTGASIVDVDKVQFTSNAETTLTFSLVITAIGVSPATLTQSTTIKIVNCSSGNVISGGLWNQNQVITDLSAGTTTDKPIAPFTYSKPDCSLSSYSISGNGASISNINYV